LQRRGDRACRDGAKARDRGKAPGERVGLLGRLDPCGHRVDLLLRLARLFGEHFDGRLRSRGQVLCRLDQALDVMDAFRVVPEARSGVTMPNSERCARIVLTSWVRWRTRKSRVL